MGVLIPNTRRQVKTVIQGKTYVGMETIAVVNNGILQRVEAGKAEGSSVDGSFYATAYVSIRPGKVIPVVAYGPDAEMLLAMDENADFTAILTPGTPGYYKFAEFITPKTAPTAAV